MRIVQGLESYPPEPQPAVVALGVFDGVHLGHREILGAAVTRARAGGFVAIACTFEPHPMEVLQAGGGAAPPPPAPPAARPDPAGGGGDGGGGSVYPPAGGGGGPGGR